VEGKIRGIQESQERWETMRVRTLQGVGVITARWGRHTSGTACPVMICSDNNRKGRSGKGVGQEVGTRDTTLRYQKIRPRIRGVGEIKKTTLDTGGKRPISFLTEARARNRGMKCGSVVKEGRERRGVCSPPERIKTSGFLRSSRATDREVGEWGSYISTTQWDGGGIGGPMQVGKWRIPKDRSGQKGSQIARTARQRGWGRIEWG